MEIIDTKIQFRVHLRFVGGLGIEFRMTESREDTTNGTSGVSHHTLQ